MPDETDPKPTITQREANWHVHKAGLEASQAAAAAGVTPEIAGQLLDAAAGLTVQGRNGPINFPPITAAFMMLLPRLSKCRETCPSFANESGVLAATAYLLGDQEGAWQALRADPSGGAFESAAFEFSSQFGLAALKQIGQWLTVQMEAIQDDEEKDTPPKK